MEYNFAQYPSSAGLDGIVGIQISQDFLNLVVFFLLAYSLV